jgi:UDPglucose 6-dehydrogenase
VDIAMAFSVSGNDVIGVIGLGPLGAGVRDHFERSGARVRALELHNGVGSVDAINEADIVFLCLPTSFRPRVGLDDQALDEAVSALEGGKVVVIMSTLLPGMTEAYQYRYPQHCFLYCPSFAREAHLRTDFLRPDCQLVGYTARSRHLSEAVLALLPSAPFRQIAPSREAEMAKCMSSAFLAIKVTFANEMHDLCSALDVDYGLVREAISADPRIGASHLDVLADGYRGYGGTALPRDVKALLHEAESLGVPLRVLGIADQVNASFLPPTDRPDLRIVPIEPDGHDPDGDDGLADERAA